MKALKLSVLFIFVSFVSAQAQSKQDFRTKFDTMIESMRTSSSYSNLDFRSDCKDFPEYVVSQSKGYLTDSVEDVREFAIGLMVEAGLRCKDSVVRKEVVFLLTNVQEIDFYYAIDRLYRFEKADFTPATKDSLRTFLAFRNKQMEVCLLVGYLDMHDQIPVLKSILNNPKLRSDKLKWKIKITLARLGDEEAAQSCIRIAKLSDCNSHAQYRLFPDMIYSRNKLIYDYLVSLLLDTTKLVSSANPNRKAKISCGYRMMELFPGIVENYPLEYYVGKQIKTDDYTKALETARQWFVANSDYVINRTRFE